MKFIFLFVVLIATLNAKNTYNSAVVFMYHHFGQSQYPSTNITLKQFENHLDYLEENNYHVWPLSKILFYIKNKYSLPDKTVALTIDDAYISIYKYAYPMLKNKRFPYTVFVNTNPIGANSINYMTWEQMKEMQRYGAEFANHSSTHAYLIPEAHETQDQWQSRVKKELDDAQGLLEEKLNISSNQRVKLLSYPFGEYTQESAKYIESLGYIGITQTSGAIDVHSDFKRIPRFAMSEKFAHMEGFMLKLNTLALPIKSVKPWGTLVESNPPKLYIELERPLSKIGCYTYNGEKIDIKWLSSTSFEVQSKHKLTGQRDRYTCTTQNKEGKWYWYSHLWILD